MRLFVAIALTMCACSGRTVDGPTSPDVAQEPTVRSEDGGPLAPTPLDGGVDVTPDAATVDAMEPADDVSSRREPADAGDACGPAIWFRDRDRDGYGERGSVPQTVCGDTSGWSSNDLDCADDDPLAHPGQTVAQSQPVVGRGGFDFDCDGHEVPAAATTTLCNSNGTTCVGVGGVGWFGDVAPRCGESATWVLECRRSGRDSCQVNSVTRPQTCL